MYLRNAVWRQRELLGIRERRETEGGEGEEVDALGRGERERERVIQRNLMYRDSLIV